MKMLKNSICSKGEWHIGNSELDCYAELQHMSDTNNQMQHMQPLHTYSLTQDCCIVQ